MSTMYVNQIAPLQGDTISVASGTFVQPGMTLQVIQTVKTNSFASGAGGVWGDIPGLSVSITPKFSTSKILIMTDVKISGNNGTSVARTRLLRDATPVYIGDAAGSRPRASGAQAYYTTQTDAIYYHAASNVIYLDSPNTISQVTYKVQIGGDSDGVVVYVNQTEGDRDTAYYDSRVPSSITVMEIAG